jgi:hypothetical protein
MATEVKENKVSESVVVAQASVQSVPLYKRSVRLLGKDVPVWVLVVVVLAAVLYVAYSNGMLNGLLGRQTVRIADRSVLPTVGSDMGTGTPEFIRRILRQKY